MCPRVMVRPMHAGLKGSRVLYGKTHRHFAGKASNQTVFSTKRFEPALFLVVLDDSVATV